MLDIVGSIIVTYIRIEDITQFGFTCKLAIALIDKFYIDILKVYYAPLQAYNYIEFTDTISSFADHLICAKQYHVNSLDIRDICTMECPHITTDTACSEDYKVNINIGAYYGKYKERLLSTLSYLQNTKIVDWDFTDIWSVDIVLAKSTDRNTLQLDGDILKYSMTYTVTNDECKKFLKFYVEHLRTAEPLVYKGFTFL